MQLSPFRSKVNKTMHLPVRVSISSLYTVFGSWLVIGASSILLAGSAFAVFISQKTNTANVLEAGTVIMYVDSNSSTQEVDSSALFSLSDIKPGDATTQSIVIKNGGSLGFSYNGSAQKDSGDDILYQALTLKIGTTNNAANVYDGLLSDFFSFVSARSLSASTDETLFYTVGLPAALVSTTKLQGKSISISFFFTAVQHL